MPTYIIKGQRVSADSPLSDEEIDEIAGTLPEEVPTDSPEGLPTNSPSGGDIATGLVTEIGIGAASQAFGATTGLGYIPIAFAGGVIGNITAQEIEGADGISWGRAIVGGFTNLIPGAKALQGIGKGTKITKALVVAAAKDQAKKGAAIGVADTSARAIIDEDRLPGPGELLFGATAGSAFGGALGGISPKISKALSGVLKSKVIHKIEGKTTDEIDELVRQGVITIEDIAQLTGQTEKQVAEFIISKEGELSEKLALKVLTEDSDPLTWFQKTFSAYAPSWALGGNTIHEIARVSGISKATISSSMRIKKAIDKAVEADKSGKLDADINNYIQGGTDVSNIPDKLLGDLDDAKALRERMQKEILIHLDEHTFRSLASNSDSYNELMRLIGVDDSTNYNLLRAKIQASMEKGNYLTRAYKLFEDPNFTPATGKEQEAVVKEIQKGFLAKFKATGKKTKKTLKDFKEAAQEHVQKLKDSSASANQLGGPNKASVEGILHTRHDVGPLQRAWMGELTDSGSKMDATLRNLNSLRTRNSGDISMMKSLQKSGLAKTLAEFEKGEGGDWVPIKLRGTIDTQELHVPPAINEALAVTYLHKEINQGRDKVVDTLLDTYFAGIGISKAVKVLLNPPSYAVNAAGGMFTMLGQGMLPGKSYLQGVKLALSSFGVVEDLTSGLTKKSRRILLEAMREMEQYNLAGGNVTASDLEATLKRAGVGGGISNKLNEVLTPIGKAYSVTDVAARFQVWMHSRAGIQKMFPKMKELDVKEFGARLTNDVFQNYDKVNSPIKTLSRLGLSPQFATFTVEFARNIANQAKYATQMMRGTFGKSWGMMNLVDAEGVHVKVDTFAMRQEGAKRMASLATLVGSTEALRRTYNDKNGVDEGTEESIRNLAIPEWDKNKSLIFNLDKDGNTGSYLNASYLTPHAMIGDLITAGVSKNPVDELVSQLQEYFVGEGTFVGMSIYRGISNRDKYNRPISNSPDKLIKFRERLAHSLYEILEPGVFREIRKGLSPEYSKEDIALRQVGIRQNNFDLHKQSEFTVRSSVQASRSSTTKYKSALNNGVASPQELEKLKVTAERDYKANMGLILENIKHMKRLGWDEDEVITTLKEGGLKSSSILSLLDGKIDEPQLNPAMTVSDMYSDLGLEGATSAEVMKKVREIALGGNRNLATALRNRFKLLRRNKRLDISLHDSLLKNMSLEERADYAIQNPDKIQELIRKRILTKSVRLRMREKGFTSSRASSYGA